MSIIEAYNTRREEAEVIGAGSGFRRAEAEETMHYDDYRKSRLNLQFR